MITPDQENDLHRFFNGSLAAAMGIKSAMGGQIDAAKLGRGRDDATRDDGDDRILEASWEYGHIEATLRTLSDGDRRVLRMVYEPLTTGETDRLETFGVNARIAVVMFGNDRPRLVALCRRAKTGKDGSKQEAMALLCGLVWQAATRAQRAKEAYSVAASNRVRGSRPWYVPGSRFSSRSAA
ncbi:MAG: hypothetical protein WC683_16200 [bacterium]